MFLKAIHFWQCVLTAGTLLSLVSPLPADILFSVVPSDGNVSGPPGSLVGWGYSLMNTDPLNWFMSTNLNSDSFSNGTPTLLFDFPILSPGTTVTEPFDPMNGIGLFELLWDSSAASGFVNSGDFVLSGQWWDGDPLNGGNFIANAPDISLPYTATVNASGGGGGGGVPEPSSLVLWASGIVAMIVWRKIRFGPISHVAASLDLKRSRSLQATALLVFVIFGSASAMAEEPSIPSDDAKVSGITRQQADEILNELRGIRQLLERQNRSAPLGQLPLMPQVPQTGKLRLEGGYSLGSNDAPVTIVEFTDYQCPYCRLFQSTTFEEIRKKYVDTGKVRFVIRDFPLVSSQPDAMRAAEAARCAGDQEKFWPMHDALFSDAGKLGKDGLINSAESIKLDMTVFRSCLETRKHKSDVQNDMQIATSLQINGTPSFLIGKANDDEVSGAIIVGAQPFSVFEAKLREAEIAPLLVH
jgi:protein-disulfide isomerase